jgi:hypothetical protein
VFYWVIGKSVSLLEAGPAYPIPRYGPKSSLNMRMVFEARVDMAHVHFRISEDMPIVGPAFFGIQKVKVHDDGYGHFMGRTWGEPPDQKSLCCPINYVTEDWKLGSLGNGLWACLWACLWAVSH